MAAPHGFGEIESVPTRHGEVRDQHVDRAEGARDFDRLLGAACGDRLVARSPDEGTGEPAHRGIVVRDENRGHRLTIFGGPGSGMLASGSPGCPKRRSYSSSAAGRASRYPW